MPAEGATPQQSLSADQINLVHEQLRLVLQSNTFVGSKRAQDFLQLVVEHALAGDFDSLRERMIGVEMFGRPVDYDTGNDAVVRVKANEVRRKLSQYYTLLGGATPVRIDLPAGSYVPKFTFTQKPLAEALTQSISTPSKQAALETSASKPSLLSRRNRLALAVTLLTLVAASTLALLRWGNPFAAREIRTIAILPLENVSGDSKQDYFADGMTAELTAELAQISALRVISRTSTMTYKGTVKTLPQIAKELQVDGILEGSFNREGSRIRITAQLVDTKTDKQIWAHSYNLDVTSILELESQVALAIADQVRAQITSQEQIHFNNPRPVNSQAVELYLRGVQTLDSGNSPDAYKLFAKAVESDPSNTAAHGALANAVGLMGNAGWMPYTQAFPLEKAEALKAIAIDDARPEPHLELGIAALNENWDWTTMEKEIQLARKINPNAASVHWAYSDYLGRIGRTKEAVGEAKLASQLDPVSSRAMVRLSFVYYYDHQYDNALALLRTEAALHPYFAEGPFPLGVIYAEQGKYDQSIREFQKLGDAPHALGHMGNAYARSGQPQEAKAAIAKLEKHISETGVGTYEIALIYIGLTDKDKAFEWLERAYQIRDKGLTYLKMDPCIEPLRSDPRLDSLLKRIGFPKA